jgi:predicted dithiol-disulfide oxidoreductase (DUF899 family)/uncharacterized protein YndB with AHSA1/START domain
MTTKSIAGAFVVEREIRIDAPRERVFSFLSSREGLAMWVPVTKFERRVGGTIMFRFLPDSGGRKVTFGEVTAYDPPARIAFTWDFKDDPLDARTEVAIDLIAQGNATLVRLTHTGFVDEEERNAHDEGWTYFLERLRARGEGNDPGEDRSIQDVAHVAAVDALRAEEIALKEHVERVAEQRRRIPLGAPLPEYTLRATDDTPVSLSALFGDKSDLLVYHFMFAPEDELGCPMCSMWIDGLNAIAPHVRQRAELVVIAKAPIEKLRAYAQRRGWDKVRVLSSFDSPFNRDFGVEDKDGSQHPAISAFRRDGERVYHFYQKFAELDDDNNRGIDLYTPVWSLFDLLPGGRPDWYPSHDYATT